MATGGARRGRRDNGIVAAEYAAAGDVDPRIGEHLLDVLGLRGIAAYLQPAADLHPITRSTTLPARPTDRLFVDRVHIDIARSFVRELTSGEADGGALDLPPIDRPLDSSHPDRTGSDRTGSDRTGSDRTGSDRTGAERAGSDALGPDGATVASGEPTGSIDDLFAAIVAGYDRVVDVADWPELENLPTSHTGGSVIDARPDDADPGPPDDPGRALRRWQDSTIQPVGWRTPGDDRGLLDGLDGLEPDGFDDDDDEGYTPPPPPPLPRFAAATIVAVVAIVVGVVIFFNPTLLPVDQTVAMVFGFCGILGGFVALIWRLRPGDDDDDHWDSNDGAVV